MGSSGAERDEEDKDSRWGCSKRCLLQCIGPVICICVGAAVGIAIFMFGTTKLLRWFLGFVPTDPGWDFTVCFCLVIAVSIVALMPFWPPLCMAAGLIFGVVVGAAVDFVALMIAAIACFVLGRSLLRAPVRQCLEEGDWPRVRRMFLILEDETNSLKFMTLFRFLFIPMFLRNYGPSTLQVPIWKLSLSAIPHSMWVSILFASVGAAFQDSAQLLREGKEFEWKSIKWQQVAIFIVALIVAVLLAWYAHHEYSKKVDEEEQKGISGKTAEEGKAGAARGNG